MAELIGDNVNQVDYAELGMYGIDHRFISDDFVAKELLQYFEMAKTQTFKPQRVIFNENTEADTIYIVVEGMVKLLSYLPNGRVRIVRLHGPGGVLGLNGLFGKVHKHKAVTVHDTVLVKIAAGSFRQLKQQYPEKFFGIVQKMYENLNIADAWITQFSTGSIKARVARLVTFLSYLESDTSPDVVELLTCDEMASVLGVTMESVSRTLADFKRRQILQRLGPTGDIYRRNAQLLMELSRDMRNTEEVIK